MRTFFHPLLALIASATDSELAKYVEYLKYENKILRNRLPKQIHTTTDERQTLLKFGKAVGKAINELITIVSPATFARWLRDEVAKKPASKKKKGGQWKPKEIRELALRISATQGVLIYWNADHRIRDAVAKAEANGGRVIEPIHGIGPHGFRAVIIDSEGNRGAFHSTDDK